jgi:integrase/recombinase XerD
MKAYRSNSLSIEEQEALYSSASSFEDLTLFRLALNTGIRREDIVGIELSSINLKSRELAFYEHKKRRVHTVPLTTTVAIDLERYINSLPKGQKHLFNFSGRTAYNKLQRTLAAAGIKKELSFHDLRRSFMKTAKKKGLDPKAVCQITGDTLSTVQNFYQNLDMEELKEEIKKL